MNAGAMATRMSVLTRALPSRILVVDDDELEAELIAGRLAAAGFEVTCAANGELALRLLDQQWYPLVITDWQMPVMDGIAFTEALRARGIEDTYVIMLSTRDASVDYERGYDSGVDDYLTKKVPDAEILARIHAAFNTLALRRSLREAHAALEQSVTIDADFGAFAAAELQGKLLAEIRRAERYARPLAVITVGVHARTTLEPCAAGPHGAGDSMLAPEVLRGIVQTIDAAVRAHVDWVARMAADTQAAFAVVLPEAGIAEVPAIKDRLQRMLRRYARVQHLAIEFSFGAAALERTAKAHMAAEPLDVLQVAEHCRACAGRAGAERLAAIQRSVASRFAISCRQGYVVDGDCPLKRAS